MNPRLSARDRSRMKDLVQALHKPSRYAAAVFLGAGASKPFGYPITRELMLEIFKNLQRQRNSAKSSPRGQARRALSEFLEHLLPGERLSEGRVPLVTGVLSLLDHSLATGEVLLPERSIEETRAVRQALEREVIETIPDHEAFAAEESGRFDRYCDWLAALRKARPHLGLITTNYDMLSDLAACYVAQAKGAFSDWSYQDVAQKIDFGFRWNDPYKNRVYGRPMTANLSLFKLHGSTNWLRCPLCENVYINPNAPIAWLDRPGAKWRGNTCHCTDTRLEAQIVSPSFVRELRDPNLVSVWKSALDLLRQSDHWIIIGYGFPDEDVAVRALFTRAFGSRPKPTRVSVVQFDDGPRVNYESFFPEGTLEYYVGGLELLLESFVKMRGRVSQGQ